MLLPRLGPLLLAAASTVLAFKDSSPFLLLSLDPLPENAPLQSVQMAFTKDVEDQLIETLAPCEHKRYYIVSQPGLRASDFRDGAMPKLQQRVERATTTAGGDETSVVWIPEVVVMGQLSSKSIEARLKEACVAKGRTLVENMELEKEGEYSVWTVFYPPLPSSAEEKAKLIKGPEDFIDEDWLSRKGVPVQASSVIIFLATPPTQTGAEDNGGYYEMDDPYPSGLHTDLKRDLAAQRRQEDSDRDFQAGLPLFERYSFLSPGIFMGLAVSLLLLMILYVGLSGISGLEVSYMAFSKEMGPQAQKGKQQ